MGKQDFSDSALRQALSQPEFGHLLERRSTVTGETIVAMAQRSSARWMSFVDGGGSWESNPPGLAFRRTSTGFEDRGRHQVGTTRRATPNVLADPRPKGSRYMTP